MIDVEKRKAAWCLHKQGVSKKSIARQLSIDPKTVRTIIEHQGEVSHAHRPERIEVDAKLLEDTFRRCDGWIQRTYEILTEEHAVKIGYSTLCRKLADMGLSETSERNQRFEEGEFYVKPGIEMQHDTSPYLIKIGGKPTRVVASGLYLRYSKMRYVKFYLSFDRFNMKCFFYEALKFWGLSASQCVIDNTNLAVLRGTGENAVMVPEMIEFAKAFGFIWKAHRIGHSNRKGGKERNFWTMETNFFPGREFKSWADLNQQVLEWSTDRYAKRPQSGTKLIPLDLFETEKSYLKRLPDFVQAPYRVHARGTDKYGYVAMHGNYYWIPGIKRESLKVIEFETELKIYRGHNLLIEIEKLSADRTNEKVRPEGFPFPKEEPEKRKPDVREEESRIRAMGRIPSTYLDWLNTPEGQVRYRYQFIKSLYQFSKRLTPSLLNAVLTRALEYQIHDMITLERMAGQIMTWMVHPQDEEPWERELPAQDYQNRPAYREGCFADEPQIEACSKLLGGIQYGEVDSIGRKTGRTASDNDRISRAQESTGEMAKPSGRSESEQTSLSSIPARPPGSRDSG
jgi:transposase